MSADHQRITAPPALDLYVDGGVRLRCTSEAMSLQRVIRRERRRVHVPAVRRELVLQVQRVLRRKWWQLWRPKLAVVTLALTSGPFKAGDAVALKRSGRGSDSTYSVTVNDAEVLRWPPRCGFGMRAP